MSQEPPWGADRGGQVAQPYPRRARRRSRRRGGGRWIAATTGVVVAATLAWVARDGDPWPGSDPAGRTTTAPTAPSALAGRTPDLLTNRETALAAILQRHASAVTSGSERLWLSDVDPERARSGAQVEQFHRLRQLPWVRWRYEVHDNSVPLPAGPTASWRASAWAVEVEVSYRLSSDKRDVHRLRTLVLRPVDGRWVIAQDVPSGDTREPWDLGPIAVLKGSHSLVVVPAAQQKKASAYVADIEAGRRKVAEVWRQPWPKTCVVYLPADEKAMAAMLGRPSVAGLDQVAAVTTGELLRGSGTSDRVVLNPTAFAGFGRAERRVVLAHELTHVATRASARLAPPMWLEEGFADYVAYRGSGVTRTQITQSLIDKVQAGSVPDHLPTAADFDPRQADIGPAYAGAWLAVDLIARSRGKNGLVAYYLQVSGVTGPAQAAAATGANGSGGEDERARQAFDDVLHTDEQAFVETWRSAVLALAGRTTS